MNTAPALTLAPTPDADPIPAAASVPELLAASGALLDRYAAAVEAITASGDEKPVKPLTDAVAALLAAVARRIDAA